MYLYWIYFCGNSKKRQALSERDVGAWKFFFSILTIISRKRLSGVRVGVDAGVYNCKYILYCVTVVLTSLNNAS